MEYELANLSYWVSILKQETQCSICLQTLKDPVTTRCFHTFCKTCIARVMKNKISSMCPLCKTQINRRGAEINSKVKDFVEKINPVIQVIKKGSSVDILSFYKGRSTSLRHCVKHNLPGEQLLGSNAALANEIMGDKDEAESRQIVLKPGSIQSNHSNHKEENPTETELNLNGISPKSVHRKFISSDRDELNSSHNNENFSELEHISVSQNISLPHLSKSKVLPTSAVKFPLVDSINSPVKKVKEWLSKNDLESSNAQYQSQSELCSPLFTISKNGIEEKFKHEEADITEFDLDKSCMGEMSKSIYKGLRFGRDAFPKHGIRNYSKSSRKKLKCDVHLNDEEQDVIQDSCPVEINDTFDRLVAEVRVTECDRPDSPLEKSDAEDQNEIGLFESLPLPAENCGSKRKHYRDVSKLEDKDMSLKSNKSGSRQKSYKENKKRKCCHYSKWKKKPEVLENVSISCSPVKETNTLLERDKPGIGEVEKCVGVDSPNKEKDESVGNEEKKASPGEKTSRRISLNPKTSLIEVLNNSATKSDKSEKKRLDLSLSSPGWSRLNSTLKDFQKSKMSTLPALDVSGGDLCNTLPNRLHLCKNVMNAPETLGVKTLSSPVCIDDAESNHTCLVSHRLFIKSQKKPEIEYLNSPNSSQSKLKEYTSIHRHEKSESKGFPDNCKHLRKISSQKADSKSGISKNVISGNYESEMATGLCEKENCNESCNSVKYKSMDLEYHSHQVYSKKSPSSTKKLKSHLSDLIVVERKTFSLNSSTQDLNELVDAIGRESTEDQLEAFAKCPLQINTSELPCEDYLKKRSSVEDCENFHFDVLTDVGCRRKHIKDRDFKANETDCNTKPDPSNGHPAQGKITVGKSKLVVPILKLGKLKEKSHTSRPKVNYYLLGKIRHGDGAVKMTSEAAIGTDSLTLLKKRLSLEKGLELKKNKEVETQTTLTFLKDQATFFVDKECQRSDNFVSLKAIPEVSHCRSENEVTNRRENALNYVIPVEENMDEEVTLIAEIDCLNSDLVKKLQRTEQNEYQSGPHSNNNSQETSSTEYVKCSATLESQNSNEELVELISNTERSGPKILLANRFKNLSNGNHMSSHKKEMNTRNYYQSSYSRRRSRGGGKPVCQLFTANAGDGVGMSEKEIALPISSTQTSELQQSNNIECANVCRLKNPRVISLSSDSSSDHEVSDRRQKKRLKNKHMSSHKKTKSLNENESLEENNAGKPTTVDVNSDDSNNKLSSTTDNAKLKFIIANIKADVNIRKNRKLISGIKLAEYGDYKNDEMNQKSNVITLPESKATTLYVEESDLSENETCNRSIKEQCENDSNSKVGSLLKEASGEESDCIIEGSQETTDFKEKSISMKKSPISLVTSGLTGREVAHVKLFAQTFHLHFSTQFCGLRSEAGIPSTTHVVTKADANGKTLYTFKYLCGIVTGCWIISIKWVNDCLTAGMLIEEEPYEVLGGDNGPYRGRNATQKLFLGFEFICKEPFSDLREGQLEEIIQLGGGKVVFDMDGFSGVKGKHIALCDASSVKFSDDFNRLMRLNDIAVISYEWVMECIEEYRIFSLTNYVLNMNTESHLKVQEKLLKMGYDEILAKTEDEPIESTQEKEGF